MTISDPAAPPPMIKLDRVSKVYPGSEIPAVSELTMDIPKGEVLVLVGPSGCGKSTTLRLINRMIEPSSGRIIFDGEDVTDVNPDELRRSIGYVIQQIGLFPHMTIGENVATVPKMLGWDKNRISKRIDELLEVVGLPPNIYRNRYPKELSGGQAQRAGVARALGADPAVMLMDEPFGAIDPITRDRLQNEFLRLQAELQKTIVFVTHDIDEAIKMGDRIAILGEQSTIRQLDTPERILAYPVDDFVDDFIGSGSTLKGLNFERVRDLDLSGYPTVTTSASHDEARRILDNSYQRFLLITDEQGRPLRWANEHVLDNTSVPLGEAGPRVVAKVEQNATLHDTLEQMLVSSAGVCCVVDSKTEQLVGVVEIETLNGVISNMRQSAKKHYDTLAEQGVTS
ncbi:MAG: betaine/proline/choline family ABC transporter ATP-binding protein [Acidimicrobiales bacterium]